MDFPAKKSLQTSVSVLWQHLSGYITTSPKKNWGKKAGILTDTNLRQALFSCHRKFT